jgi:Holliday junction resolvasome RuvABC endonuclease subunit
VLGIDASLTGTAIVVVDIDEETGTYTIVSSDLIETKGSKSATLRERFVRLRTIADTVEHLAWQGDFAPDLAVIEAPSYGSSHGHAHDRSGLWWLIVDTLLGFGVRVASVPPQTRAKYATGKGNAGKDAVLAAVVRGYPEFEVDNNNVADATVLTAMGCRFMGFPLEDGDLSQQRLDAMSGAAWLT